MIVYLITRRRLGRGLQRVKFLNRCYCVPAGQSVRSFCREWERLHPDFEVVFFKFGAASAQGILPIAEHKEVPLCR